MTWIGSWRMPEIVFCTTHAKKLNSPTVFTAQRRGLAIETFGVNTPFAGFVETKLAGLRKFLEGRTEEYCAFLDGNDIVVVGDEREIMQRYKELTAGRSPVLIGSELCLWPYPHLKADLDATWEKSGSKSAYHYLDTGLMMGPVDALKDILDVLLERVKHYHKTLPNVQLSKPADMLIGYADVRDYIMCDDVGLWSLALCDGYVEATVDYDCKMICAVLNCPDEDIRMARGRLTYLPTGGRPCFVHGNGHRYVDRKRLDSLGGALVGKEWCKP